MPKIIGIDPGLSATGVGIVRGSKLKIDGYSFGSINTSKDTSLPDRLAKIFSELFSIIEKEKPDLMVVEDIFSLKAYPKSGIMLGQVSGVVLLCAAQASIQSIEIPVREAKQVLTGNGNASKLQLEQAVRNYLKHPDPIKPYHASDALGLAVIGLFRYQGSIKH